MTDPQKKKNWNELADQIGAGAPPETPPAVEPEQPVTAVTPPPPPKRKSAPVKKSGWGAIANLLGIESTPEAEAPQADPTPPEPEPVITPETPAAIEEAAEPDDDAMADDPMADDPMADEPMADEPSAADVAMESSWDATESTEVTPDVAEEPTVRSRGSSRGRRRRGGKPTAEESRDDAPAPSDELAANSVSSGPDHSKVDFADDEDPLLLQHDTFVDEVDVAHDDESDSIDNAEVAPSAESEEQRPKRRRRRGRRGKRRDGASTNGTGEKTNEAADDTSTAEESGVSDEVGDAVRPSDEETGIEKSDDDQPGADERAPRKRRRGRRRRGGKRDEPAAGDAATAETSETTGEAGLEESSSSEGELYEDDLVADDDYDNGEEKKAATESRHRKIPTWSDAIGGIVDSNLASRSKNPSPPRRGRGGRGRGRQGDRPKKS